MSLSLAGTWGSEQLLYKDPVDIELRSSTIMKEQYSLNSINKQRKEDQNAYAKFKKMTDSKSMIMTYSEKRGDDINSLSTNSISSVSSNIPTDANHHDPTRGLAMHKTAVRIMKSGDAPVAIGRSGARPEGGKKCTGLLGEQLKLTREPSRNTLVQRCWLPGGDPAVNYKMNGVPVAEPRTDMSLDLKANFTEQGWVHQRKAILTGDCSTKTGAIRSGIFLDENDHLFRKQNEKQKTTQLKTRMMNIYVICKKKRF